MASKTAKPEPQIVQILRDLAKLLCFLCTWAAVPLGAFDICVLLMAGLGMLNPDWAQVNHVILIVVLFGGGCGGLYLASHTAFNRRFQNTCELLSLVVLPGAFTIWSYFYNEADRLRGHGVMAGFGEAIAGGFFFLFVGGWGILLAGIGIFGWLGGPGPTQIPHNAGDDVGRTQ